MNKYDYFFIAGLALWLIETWMFGWNAEPSGIPEKMFDAVSLFLVGYGGLCGLVSSINTNLNITIKNI